jgi:hypothetical protein
LAASQEELSSISECLATIRGMHIETQKLTGGIYEVRR